MEQQESEFVEHVACDACGSSDGNALFSDGHTYCYVCEAYKPGDQGSTTPAPAKTVNPFTSDTFLKGEYKDLAKRKLTADVCKSLGYQVGEYQGNPCHIAPIYNDKQQLVAQKIRLPGKDFRVLGDLKAGGLIFQHKFKPGGKRLVITEGEIDALSYASVAPGWEVVSLPNGAAGAAKSIKRSLEFVDSFDEVCFMLDNDEPGREAAIACAELLSPGKAKIVTLPLKDANEMLIAGKIKELKNAVYGAKPFSPEGIVLGSDLTIAELQSVTPKGHCIPYVQLNKMTRGLRKRELVMLCAGSGIGKSSFARELGYHLATEHDQKVGYVMLEESVAKTAQAMIALDNNVPLGDLMEESAILSQQQWEDSFKKVVEPAAFYDSFGSTETDNLIAKMRYLAVGLECDFIVLDHVSMVVSGGTDDERKALDILMTKLRQMVENTGVGVIAISHIKRGNKDKSYNEGAQISLTDLRGSAAIEQLSDIVIGLERDQQSEDDSNVTKIRLLKNRPFGNVGPAGHMSYQEATGRMDPIDFEPTHNEIPQPTNADAPPWDTSDI